MAPNSTNPKEMKEGRPIPGRPRYSDLSAPRQRLVRLCESINYGYIHELRVQEREPLFDPPPVVLVDAKLDSDEGPRRELDITDFELPEEVRGLVCRLDEIENGKISRLEVRAGIPRRVLFKSRLLRGESISDDIRGW